MRVYLLILLLSISANGPAYSENQCLLDEARYLLERVRSPGSKREKLREQKALELAKILEVDEEAGALLKDPRVAQYIYVNHFAPEPYQKELEAVLKDVIASMDEEGVDLYKLVNEKLDAKLKDPEVKKKVEEAFKGEEYVLRPGKLRSSVSSLKTSLNQFINFPRSVARIRRLTYEGFDQDTMDRGLFDFYGATQLGLKDSQLRPWDKLDGGYADIKPNQVENMSPNLWAEIAHFASETEMPIHGYSTNSGDALRGIMPSVSSFMGKNFEEYLAFEKKRKDFEAGKIEDDVGPFCTNVWCREENRHENAIERIAEQVTGKKKEGPKTYEADKRGDYLDPNYALLHLAGRNSSEWNANSVYLFLRGHSRGPANKMVDNIRRDETKHMAIFSAAYKYVFGSQLGKRTKEMIDKILYLKKVASDSNSSGSVIEASKLTLLEFAATHLFVEKKVRDFMRSVPLKTMEKIYETPVKTLKELESMPVSPSRQKLIDEMIARERASRERLERWTPKEREKYLALKQIEQERGHLIESLVENLFDGFRGAEVPGSKAAKDVLKRIKKLKTGLSRKENALIQLSLRETLRDYQIMNNSRVRGDPSLKVRFKNAREGFIVEHKGPGETLVLDSRAVTDETHLIRVEKPKDLGDLKIGDAIRVEIQTPEGKEFRVLSLASTPDQDHLEFAVGLSDSTFKQAFKEMRPGTTVTLAKARGSMDFDTTRPAVMIAGGIGITPFRSMIQFAKNNRLETPMHLYYANRKQIPFGDEFNELAVETPNLDVTTILSRPDDSWKGLRGRIDDDFLKGELPHLPEDSVYYIVGPPPMITGVKSSLKAMGVSEDRIKTEIFATAPKAEIPARSTIDKSDDVKKSLSDEKPDKTICHCFGIGQNAIEQAIDAGADTMEKIESVTQATTGCGGCACNVEKILACKLKAR